jgi:hypothetical protein
MSAKADALMKMVLTQLKAELLPDSITHSMRIKLPSTSNPNKKYIMSKRNYSTGWECSCTGWINHHKDCRHIKRAAPMVEKVLSAIKKVG